MIPMSLLLTIIFALIVSPIFTQENKEINDEGLIDKAFNTAEELVDWASTDSWTFIPALTYSPETSWGIGARTIKVFRATSTKSDGDLRPSTLPITFLYTLENQAIFTSELELWKDENKDYLHARLELTDYPFKFYGIGNELRQENEEDYASRYIYFHLQYQRELLKGFYLGPRYEFRADNIYYKIPEGLLESGNIPGSNHPRLSGLGITANFDTRDNIFQPSGGSFHQFSWMSFQSFLGGNFTFNQYQLDLRKYIRIFDRHVIAMQSWWSFTYGNPPFQHLSLIGGSDIMRGYFEGRYRDRQAMVYQAEYRMPVYRKLGLVFFGSAGQVAPQFRNYSFDRFRYGGGFGFRYRLNDEGLNIRLDIAFGDQKAFYFGLNEVI
ncbi:BamA/TamA family outer membrane protein [Echinicola jeungdonensis]|uniref:BamA/TamA family outer membrane protein n=1 Tax=Echinicola jeungdonensis TaxID=709343 RepID=A0ABV5J761_9BACT|nr:BamA/TamA family outer membrane protein [Echinicola jeungdonensis]MDN3669233.1 BamA/TamA family outer membrane protein [Echinicola jeungdonensis]